MSVLLAGLAVAFLLTPNMGVTDFAAYWTAGQLLASHQNPYSTGTVMAMEHQLGFTEPQPLVMRNPPWALPFALPLGLLTYSLAQRLWIWICLACILLSTRWLWVYYASAESPWVIGWAVTLLFIPVATVLALGQIGPLVLLGIAGFLVYHDKHQDFAAGLFAFLIALKPHLAFLFWPALLLWVVRGRRWQVLGGFSMALIAACAVPLLLEPQVFMHYRGLWQETVVVWTETPTIGGALCHWLGRDQRWLAFTPAVIATAWFAAHYWRAKHDWQWREQMPILLLVSVASSPYAWFFDQVILLPAVLQQTARLSTSRRWLWPGVTYVLLNGLILILILNHRTVFWYAWTAPAWLIFYLFLYRRNAT